MNIKPDRARSSHSTSDFMLQRRAAFSMKAGASDHILPFSPLRVVVYFLNEDLKPAPFT